MSKAIFLDRDGTINFDCGYLSSASQLTLLDGVVEALRSFSKCGYLLFVVTNQSGVARGYFSREDADSVNIALRDMLVMHGVEIREFFTCYHAPAQGCDCRKPSPKFIVEAIEKYHLNAAECYMLGDKSSDVEAGVRAGVESYLVDEQCDILFWSKEILKRV